MVFAFITVVITVHAYVFYSIYVVNGDSLRQAVGTTSVLPVSFPIVFADDVFAFLL